ncbi:MAG TPA: serine hydrolase, partial [Parachlamydiaceae bacterium]|nr:serine hydrolase [Parachlamydiaceae bacterium]
MNHVAFAGLALLLILTQPLSAKADKLALSVNAEAAILMNADAGAILYEKNAHNLHYPASTLKIATALYALQKVADKMDVMIAADQDCIGTVKEEAIRKSNYTLPSYLLIPDGSHIGIKRGEILSLRDLFYGMMVASGDDAANVIAKYTSGTIPQFIAEMNSYVKQLGCHSTTFYNPHGLHHPKQQTTAFDLATLTREALKNPVFCEMIGTVRYTRPKTNKQEPSTLVQTNRLLRTGPYYYPKAFGVKTGYYSLAGNNLVAAAKDGDRTLIAVVMK